jgi:phosphatidate cytidylyltransferase
MSNLATRVIVAVIAIPLILAAAYLGNAFFFLFTTALVVIATNEFYSLAKKRSLEPAAIPGIVSAAALNLIAYDAGLSAALYLLLLIIPFLLLFELSKKRTDGVRGTFENVGATLTAVVYIGLFSAALTTIRQRYGIENIFPTERSAGLFVITIFLAIWICDSAAYFVGISAGKHKMSKFVSPNKSWEGAVAGFVFAVATSVAARFLVLPELKLNLAVGTGLVIGVLGQAGDFVESMFKRDAGAKDSSEMIPGHGGVLDRFDSLLFSSPFIYLLLRYLG